MSQNASPSGTSQSASNKSGTAANGLHQTLVHGASQAARFSSDLSRSLYGAQTFASSKRANSTSANAVAMNVPSTYCTENQLRSASASA